MKFVDVPKLMASIARPEYPEETLVSCNTVSGEEGDYLLFFTTGEGIQMKTDIPDYYSGIVFLAISDATYSGCMTKAKKAMSLFDFSGKKFDIEDDPLLQVDFKLCRPEALPVAFPKNEAGNIECLLSFEVTLSVSDK